MTKYEKLGDQFAQEGKTLEAIRFYQKAINQDGKNISSILKLGSQLYNSNDYQAVINHYQKHISSYPNYFELYYNLGKTYCRLGQYKRALSVFIKAKQLQPKFLETYLETASILARLGQLNKAIENSREAIQVNPTSHKVHSNLLFYMNMDPAYTNEKLFAEYKNWNKLHTQDCVVYDKYLNSLNTEKQIRLAFVSPDLRNHVVGHIIQPFFKHYDRNRFQITCYYNHNSKDQHSEEIRSLVDKWYDVFDLTNDALAEKIHQEKIDILVDMVGHMNGNRLMAFAQRPAPIQVTQTGFPNTTGLSAMDYRISDFYLDPPGLTDDYHSEKIIRLDSPGILYNPPENSPPVAAAPFLENGHITFGCLNNYVKVSELAVKTWSLILNALPDSKLLLLVAEGEDVTEALHRRFLKYSISPDRIQPAPLCDRENFLLLHHHVDIALDPFPYTGFFSSVEALWMGVPVITISGKNGGERHGVSIYNYLERTEWIADSYQEYIRIALKLAKDKQILQKTRQELRQEVQNSPLIDGQLFTREISKVYSEMWKNWCQSQQ
ncbi:MAG: tetratricopeptide repeat protein [Verrucomicrobiota bacterium]